MGGKENGVSFSWGPGGKGTPDFLINGGKRNFISTPPSNLLRSRGENHQEPKTGKRQTTLCTPTPSNGKKGLEEQDHWPPTRRKKAPEEKSLYSPVY